MSIELGFVAEDETDCRALAVLAKRIVKAAGRDPNTVKIRKRHTNGCARLRKKAGLLLQDLAREGCTRIVIVHDLDRNRISKQLNDEDALRVALAKATASPPAGIIHAICIPVEELEAWFLADPGVVKLVGRGKNCSTTFVNPHLVHSPKEWLEDHSKDERGKALYSTNDNEELAAALDLDLCKQRCRAFKELHDFVVEHCAA